MQSNQSCPNCGRGAETQDGRGADAELDWEDGLHIIRDGLEDHWRNVWAELGKWLFPGTLQ